MNTQTIITTVPSGSWEDAQAFLNTVHDQFVQSAYLSIGIDITKMSMIPSSLIGVLAKIIKTATNRGGRTILFASSDATYNMLQIIHFDKIATIVRDSDDFKKECEQSQPAAQSNTGKRSQHVPSKSPEQPQTTTELKKVPQPLYKKILADIRFAICSLVIAIVGLLSTAILLSLLVIQSQNVKRITHESLQLNSAVKEYAQKSMRTNDSLTTLLNKCHEETKLITELCGSEEK